MFVLFTLLSCFFHFVGYIYYNQLNVTVGQSHSWLQKKSFSVESDEIRTAGPTAWLIDLLPAAQQLYVTAFIRTLLARNLLPKSVAKVAKWSPENVTL